MITLVSVGDNFRLSLSIDKACTKNAQEFLNKVVEVIENPETTTGD
jgi:hypothetical protein